MAGKSTLDPDNLSDRPEKRPPGHDTRSLGPSDSSDSGSDMPNAPGTAGDEMDADSDQGGTGERPAAGPARARAKADADRGTDRVVDESEAGLGGGEDQAE